MIILDTHVLSEPWRPRPSPVVMEWMRAQPATALFTTSITEADLYFGLALLPHGKRRQSLAIAVDRVFAEDFAGRVLPFGSAAAREYATIAAARRRTGRPTAIADAQIAAIARSRGAAVATRNLADYGDCGISVVDP